MVEVGAERCACGSESLSEHDPLATSPGQPGARGRAWSDQRSSEPPPPVATNPYALLSLVFAFLIWPLGLIFGIVALRQIPQTNEQGKEFAIAGLVLSILFGVVTLIALLAIASSAG